MTDLTDEAVKSLLEGATPGPWLWEKEEYDEGRCWHLAPGVLILDADGGGPDGADEIDAANARLIAAAPDLARALLASRAELAAVEALRVEARENAMQALASMGQAQEAYEAQLEAEAELARVKAREARRSFPILKGEGAKIDYQLVSDHAEQAKSNHYQSVERLAERGGLSWCELYAVLHNRKWEKIDNNEAMIACRALEARYLAALAQTPTDPGDGWTWNERLGWIGPDGKPAARGGA